MGKLFGWLKANKGKVGLVVGTVAGLLGEHVPGVTGVLEAIAKALGN